jgi:hypothetical protein
VNYRNIGKEGGVSSALSRVLQILRQGNYANAEGMCVVAEEFLRAAEARWPDLWDEDSHRVASGRDRAEREEAREKIGEMKGVLRAYRVLRLVLEDIRAEMSRYRFTTPEECRGAADWLFFVIETHHGPATARKIFNELATLKRRKEVTDERLRGLIDNMESMEKAAERLARNPDLLQALELPRYTSKDTLRKRLNRLANPRKN